MVVIPSFLSSFLFLLGSFRPLLASSSVPSCLSARPAPSPVFAVSTTVSFADSFLDLSARLCDPVHRFQRLSNSLSIYLNLSTISLAVPRSCRKVQVQRKIRRSSPSQLSLLSSNFSLGSSIFRSFIITSSRWQRRTGCLLACHLRCPCHFHLLPPMRVLLVSNHTTHQTPQPRTA